MPEISDELPIELMRRARLLCDDENFIDSIHSAAIMYHDLRQFEAMPLTSDSRKLTGKSQEAGLARLIKAAREYKAAAILVGVAPSATDIKLADERIAACEQLLDTSKQHRTTYNKTLRTTCKRVGQIFDQYGVSRRKLGAFLCVLIPLAAPECDVIPSDSQIKKRARNPEI